MAALLAAHGVRLESGELDLYMKACLAEPVASDELGLIGALLDRVRQVTAKRLPDDFKVFREFWLKLCRRNDGGQALVNAFVKTSDFCFLAEKHDA